MKRKLRGIVAIVVACLAISCVVENTLPQNFQTQVDTNLTIPVEQAINNLNDFLIRHNQETKSRGITLSDVIIVSSQNITRSNGELLPAIDSLLYLVNFEDNAGYAILSADRRIGTPIIAITETGSINTHSFNMNIKNFGNSTPSNDFDLPISSSTPSVPIIGGSQVVNDMIVEFVSGRIIGGYAPNSDNLTSIDNTSSYWVAPILTTIWGQGTPYNLKCPVEENGEHNPAGCVAIALGQVIAHFEAERTDVSKEYDWQVIKSVGNYNGSTTYNKTQEDEISIFIKDIGDMCCMDYDDGGSSSLPWKIDNCLQDFGFENSDFYWGYDIDDITTSLIRGYPVIISAARLIFGHTWVIDGYDTHYNPDDEDNNIIVHCNWGWNGECNGFYYSGVFNLSDGAVIVDENYGDISDTSNRNYNWMFSSVLPDIR